MGIFLKITENFSKNYGKNSGVVISRIALRRATTATVLRILRTRLRANVTGIPATAAILRSSRILRASASTTVVSASTTVAK